MRKEYINQLECVGHGIWEWNPIANLISLSPQWITMLGYDVKGFEQTKDKWMSLLCGDLARIYHLDFHLGFHLTLDLTLTCINIPG
mgnify:CR=1 FL=1